jgi:hypothetical protein
MEQSNFYPTQKPETDNGNNLVKFGIASLAGGSALSLALSPAVLAVTPRDTDVLKSAPDAVEHSDLGNRTSVFETGRVALSTLRSFASRGVELDDTPSAHTADNGVPKVIYDKQTIVAKKKWQGQLKSCGKNYMTLAINPYSEKLDDSKKRGKGLAHLYVDRKLSKGNVTWVKLKSLKGIHNCGINIQLQSNDLVDPNEDPDIIHAARQITYQPHKNGKYRIPYPKNKIDMVQTAIKK